MDKGSLFIVSAPSGAGKTTLVSALLAAEPQAQLSVSYTSRAMRAGEENGVNYHFISRLAFEHMIEAGAFLEHAEVFGHYYGTSQAWINQALVKGQDIVLEIDWQGAQQVRRVFPEAIGIFVLPPSLLVLEERLRERGKDSEEMIARRLGAAREEISHISEFDFVIINAIMHDAIQDIVTVVRAQRLRFSSQSRKFKDLITSLRS